MAVREPKASAAAASSPANIGDVIAIAPAAWDPATWAALGVWATVVVYVVLAVYAFKQVGEARSLREEQVRPFVVVHFEVDWITRLVVENVGTTMATDVRVTFEPALASTLTRPWNWEESTLFTSGIPSLPPNKRIVVDFDTIIQRFESDLPLSYTAGVAYRGPGKLRYSEHQVLDLALYKGTNPPEDGLPQLVKGVKDLVAELAKWTDGVSGLQVNVSDRDRSDVRQMRYWHVRRANDLRRSEGIRAMALHEVRRLLVRYGWLRR